MTLRRAIRRFLRILLALAAVSILAFWGMAQLGPHTEGFAHNPFRQRPLFVNLDPQGVADLAREAVRSVATRDARSGPSAQTLARLGGAALPHVLPKLDTLDPNGRARVALALNPIAVRMGIADAADVMQPEQAILFWNRFWQDRAIDFRPPVVKRLAARVAQRSLALRREDVLHLDTYALEELIRVLGDVRDQGDVHRVQRLSSVLSQITGRPTKLPKSVGEARRVVEDWQLFWVIHGSDYLPLDGARRIAAIVTETQYGKWFMLVLRARFGNTVGGEPVLAVVRRQLAVTSASIAGLLLGSLAVIACLRSGSVRPTRRELGLAMPLLTAELPLLLTLAVGLELVFGLPGAGAGAVAALGAGDVNAWMGLALALALTTLVLTSLLSGTISPSTRLNERGER